ncbi:putative DNA-binding transcriptional regulator YafY [Motilibacter peucedani]|uniref:Putative DNA-binding transcriptional regulator YafY n=1 Tax=Motilibacter peucedani TaxID=598650 RepID=A0A420XVE8_9ACTN|nr:YafY family protein [Motilibacter peucedani]RKS84276.1 putative DNA-binding transcriptional regulator YafY [Motilibacter peucedani]
MGATGTRMLQLMSLLQSSRYWAGAELASRLEVSPRTLRRDVERLRELGYPVEARRGVDGGYQLAPGASLPPLVLDDEEAVALALGLQAAAQSAVEGMAESSVRALAKVVGVMPRRLRRRVEALTAATETSSWQGVGPAVDPATLTTLAQACRDAERVEMDYTAADGQRSHRHVEPHRLVPLGRRWYVVAYDDDRSAWRSFRADRISGARVTGERFAPRRLPADDAVDFVRSGVRGEQAGYAVVATVHASAAEVVAKIGRWATVTSDEGEHCRITMHADAAEWPLMALGSLQAEFRIEAPEELRDEAAAWGARVARAGAAAT